MTKNEFITCLEDRLSSLPKEDAEKAIEYYSEMIDERIEDGLSEEEAVNDIGSIDDIVLNIVDDIALPKLIKTKVKKGRSIKAWEIVLLVLGAPVWLPILISVIAILLSIYIVLWSIVLVFYSITLSFAVAPIAGIVGMAMSCAYGNVAQGLMFLSAGLVLAGFAILFFHLSTLMAKGVIIIGKKFVLAIKRCFVKKEAA